MEAMRPSRDDAKCALCPALFSAAPSMSTVFASRRTLLPPLQSRYILTGRSGNSVDLRTYREQHRRGQQAPKPLPATPSVAEMFAVAVPVIFAVPFGWCFGWAIVGYRSSRG